MTAQHLAAIGIVIDVAMLALVVLRQDIKRHWPAIRAYLLLDTRSTPPSLTVDLVGFTITAVSVLAVMACAGQLYS